MAIGRTGRRITRVVILAFVRAFAGYIQTEMIQASSMKIIRRENRRNAIVAIITFVNTFAGYAQALI